MSVNTLIDKTLTRLKELWQYKIFKITIVVHLFYFVLSLVLVLIFFRNQNDFLVYYQAGGVVSRDINDLYNQDNYLWDYRYFPLSAFIFIPYYLLGFDLGFTVFHFVNLFLNILSAILMYKIIINVRGQDHEKNEDRVITYICIYLMALPQIFNYVLGQINLYITLFILISLYLFINQKGIVWNLIASLFLGFSIIIKPTTLFMIPFLIILNFDIKERKLSFDLLKSIIRILGTLIPIMLNFILFFLYPPLWKGFLNANLMGESIVDTNFSFSITRNILNFLIVYGTLRHHLVIFLIIVIIIGVSGFLAYMIGNFGENKIIFGYAFGMLIMLLTYFDSWDHHLVSFIPLIIIILFVLPRESKITQKFIKPSLLFLSFLDLAFMGLYFIVENIFPFHITTTIFLMIIFLSLAKFGLSNKNEKIDD